jgi:hypothetical protein
VLVAGGLLAIYLWALSVVHRPMSDEELSKGGSAGEG